MNSISEYRVTIIGTGNIAHFFGAKLKDSNCKVIQVISTNEAKGSAFAKQFDCIYHTDVTEILPATDIVIFAVPDDVLREMASLTVFTSKLCIYAAGTVSLQEVSNLSNNVACIWPVYSIQQNNLPITREIPLVCTLTQQSSIAIVQYIAKIISNQVFFLSDEKKQFIHLSAVWINNFTNHMLHIGFNVLTEQHLPKELLFPILTSTIENAQIKDPQYLQTGPAIRRDQQTINKHLQLLHNSDSKLLYEVITASIQNNYPINK